MSILSYFTNNEQKCSKGNTGNFGADICDEGIKKRNRCWVFTSFSETEPKFHNDMKYLLYAPEVCPETNRKHWQGYVYYYNELSITQSQNRIGGGKHHHKMSRADLLNENKSYIIGPYEKNGKKKPFNKDAVEKGNEPKQGRRNDVEELVSLVSVGSLSCDEVAIHDPIKYHQYGRTLDRVEEIYMSKIYRKEMTEGIWIYGPTGVGKSHLAFEGFTPETHYVVPDDNGWWDNYRQQDIVIFNDYRGWIRYERMLELMDKYPTEVKRRGRPPLPFTSKMIIITSSLPPWKIYQNRNEEDSLDQLKRRCEIRKMEKKGEWKKLKFS